jgi:hypothetical protein
LEQTIMALSRFFVAAVDAEKGAIHFFTVLAPTQADAEELAGSHGTAYGRFVTVRALPESEWLQITQRPLADYITTGRARKT